MDIPFIFGYDVVVLRRSKLRKTEFKHIEKTFFVQKIITFKFAPTSMCGYDVKTTIIIIQYSLEVIQFQRMKLCINLIE